MSSCHSTRQVTDSRRGGPHSTTVPAVPTRPSGMRRMNFPPTFRSISTAWPKKYWRVNSASVSAAQTFSGNAAI